MPSYMRARVWGDERLPIASDSMPVSPRTDLRLFLNRYFVSQPPHPKERQLRARTGQRRHESWCARHGRVRSLNDGDTGEAQRTSRKKPPTSRRYCERPLSRFLVALQRHGQPVRHHNQPCAQIHGQRPFGFVFGVFDETTLQILRAEEVIT